MIKLFNAILVASRQAEEDAPTPGEMATLRADVDLGAMKGARKERDNVLGRGGKRGEGLTKEGFLDMVRRG